MSYAVLDYCQKGTLHSVQGLWPNHTKADCSHEASEYRCSMDIKVSEATYNCKIGFT